MVWFVLLACRLEKDCCDNEGGEAYPSAHDVARLVEDNGTIIAYYSGLESVYYDATTDGWQLGLGHNDDAPLSGDAEPSWLPDSPVADVIPNTAPAMLDARTMYYCKADWELDDGSACIGRATATGTPPLELQWMDDGEPIVCSDASDVEAGAPFAIDPAVIEDDGRLWMSYGSHYSGIWLVELDPSTGRIKDEATWESNPSAFTHLASYPDGSEENYVEAPFIYKNEGFYYLFVNWDQCCNGLDSTYNIRVGRASDIQGPFLDKDGVAMAEGGGSLFLGSEGRFVGPGHAGISELEGFGLVFSFHFYDQEKDGEGTLGIRALRFEAGWPVLEAAALGRQSL